MYHFPPRELSLKQHPEPRACRTCVRAVRACVRACVWGVGGCTHLYLASGEGRETHVNSGQAAHEQLELAAGEDGNEIRRHQLVEALLEGIDLLNHTVTTGATTAAPRHVGI